PVDIRVEAVTRAGVDELEQVGRRVVPVLVGDAAFQPVLAAGADIRQPRVEIIRAARAGPGSLVIARGERQVRLGEIFQQRGSRTANSAGRNYVAGQRSA